MTNTNIYEERIAESCRSFGGNAAELVDALERLDEELNKAIDRINELEVENKALESEIEELRSE